MSGDGDYSIRTSTYSYYLGQPAGTIRAVCPHCREQVEVEVLLQSTYLYEEVLEAHVHVAPVIHRCRTKNNG